MIGGVYIWPSYLWQYPGCTVTVFSYKWPFIYMVTANTLLRKGYACILKAVIMKTKFKYEF